MAREPTAGVIFRAPVGRASLLPALDGGLDFSRYFNMLKLAASSALEPCYGRDCN